MILRGYSTAEVATFSGLNSGAGGVISVTGGVIGPAGPVTDVVSVVHDAASKSVPADADEMFLADSAVSFGVKKLTWASLKSALGSATQTLTNKRFTPRVNSVVSSATPSINTDTTDEFIITALATAITSMSSGLSGTPTEGQMLLVRIKDNGTARLISWGSSFISSGVGSLPTTTVASKTHLVGFIYDGVAAKWACVASDGAGY